MGPSPPYIPTPYLIASSRLTTEELVLNFEDFKSTLRYVSTAPELVFERLISNVSGCLQAAIEAGSEDGSPIFMHQQARGNTATGSDTSDLETCQFANQNLTRQLQEAYIALDECQLAKQDLFGQLVELNDTICATGLSESDAAKAVGKANPVIGTFKTSEHWSKPEIGRKTAHTVSFGNRYNMVPGIVVGLTLVDIDCNTTARVSGYASAIQVNSFNINLDSWADTTLFGAVCNWLEIPADDLDFQYGSYHTIEHYHWSKTPLQNPQKITFKRAYASPPKVVVWVNLFDLGTPAHWRVKTFTTDVTATGFTLHLDSWADSKLMWTMASWIAYPADRPGLVSGSFSTRDIRSSGQPQLYNSAFEPFPSGVFETPPKVFLALNSLEMNNKRNLRLKVSADNVSAAGMTWHLDSWMDSILHSAGASYIAFA